MPRRIGRVPLGYAGFVGAAGVLTAGLMMVAPTVLALLLASVVLVVATRRFPEWVLAVGVVASLAGGSFVDIAGYGYLLLLAAGAISLVLLFVDRQDPPVCG